MKPVSPDAPPLGIGFYTVPEAARLIRVSQANIRRWLGGYSYHRGEKSGRVPPLWRPELPANDKHLELGFRDLIELRFVNAFVSEGLDLRIVRSCLDQARQLVNDPRPFSTQRFRTDGRTIFLQSLTEAGQTETIDLKRNQYVFNSVIEKTFRDLDLEDEVVARWRPFRGKKSVVVDPGRAFGQPIVTDYGVPTIALADSVKAERSATRVAALFELPLKVVQEAVQFEQYLRAA